MLYSTIKDHNEDHDGNDNNIDSELNEDNRAAGEEPTDVHSQQQQQQQQQQDHVSGAADVADVVGDEDDLVADAINAAAAETYSMVASQQRQEDHFHLHDPEGGQIPTHTSDRNIVDAAVATQAVLADDAALDGAGALDNGNVPNDLPSLNIPAETDVDEIHAAMDDIHRLEHSSESTQQQHQQNPQQAQSMGADDAAKSGQGPSSESSKQDGLPMDSTPLASSAAGCADIEHNNKRRATLTTGDGTTSPVEGTATKKQKRTRRVGKAHLRKIWINDGGSFFPPSGVGVGGMMIEEPVAVAGGPGGGMTALAQHPLHATIVNSSDPRNGAVSYNNLSHPPPLHNQLQQQDPVNAMDPTSSTGVTDLASAPNTDNSFKPEASAQGEGRGGNESGESHCSNSGHQFKNAVEVAAASALQVAASEVSAVVDPSGAHAAKTGDTTVKSEASNSTSNVTMYEIFNVANSGNVGDTTAKSEANNNNVNVNTHDIFNVANSSKIGDTAVKNEANNSTINVNMHDIFNVGNSDMFTSMPTGNGQPHYVPSPAVGDGGMNQLPFHHLSAGVPMTTDVSCGIMLAAPRNGLGQMGGVGSASVSNSKHDEKWNAVFQKLVEYKLKHGHTMVPQCYKEDQKLGRWVHYQRVEYWLFMATPEGRGKITPYRIARLNSIGFEWDPQKAQWDMMFERLKKVSLCA
jgi:hypothetical protein